MQYKCQYFLAQLSYCNYIFLLVSMGSLSSSSSLWWYRKLFSFCVITCELFSQLKLKFSTIINFLSRYLLNGLFEVRTKCAIWGPVSEKKIAIKLLNGPRNSSTLRYNLLTNGMVPSS